MKMMKKINFTNPSHQFFIVLATNLLFFIALYSCPASNYNIHPPEGVYSENLFSVIDVVPSYINPARNFIKFGTFGNGNIPDHFRTVGYPAYLAGLIILFGNHFFWVAILIQAILSALIFPIVSAIANFFIKNDQRISKMVFIFLWLSGAYWSYFYMLTTDMFFAFFFIAGIYYGIKAMSEKSFKYCILHLLFIGYAASVRPVLILYVIPEFFILVYSAMYFKTIAERKTKVLIGVASISILFLTNLSSLRNYVNYGVMKPSDAFEYNLNDSANQALALANKEGGYRGVILIPDSVDWVRVCLLEKKEALRVMKSYPKETLIVLMVQLAKNLGTPHYLRGTLMFLFKKTNNNYERTVYKNDINSLKQTIGLPLLLLSLLIICIYLFSWLLVIIHMFRVCKNGKYLYAMTILLFMGYMIFPILFAGAGSRYRLPIDWLIILLSTIEFYYLLDAYKLRRATRVVKI